MAFWSSADSEAKRNYRFKVTIGGNAIWYAKTCTLPSYDVSEVEHNHMDNKYYFPGRVSWSEVTVNMVDPITPDAAAELNKMLKEMGYLVPGGSTSAVNKATIDKTNSGLLVVIEVLDKEGVSVEKWELKNSFIKAAKFGDLDYSNDELKTVELTIRYDWAVHTDSDGATYFTQEGA